MDKTKYSLKERLTHIVGEYMEIVVYLSLIDKNLGKLSIEDIQSSETIKEYINKTVNKVMKEYEGN